MCNLRVVFCLVSLFFTLNSVRANVILVENTADSGTGSLREAISIAAPFDTILINTKGTITLNSSLLLDGKSDLTIIGPYPKHNKITPNSGWSGNLILIQNCERITIQGLGFVGSVGTTRHVSVLNCPDQIIFRACLFENGLLNSDDGAAIKADDASVFMYQCSFINNTAVKGGAASFIDNAVGTLVNCTFSGNYATDKAGALSLVGNATVYSYYCTYVLNNSAAEPTTVRGTGSTEFYLEHNAIGNNGSGRQIQQLGNIYSYGGNIVKLNYLLENTGILSLLTGDYFSSFLILGLRPTILEDGFGLKYWPIVDPSSDLINPTANTIRTPEYDCRNAPRSLKGTSSFLTYPDAGAVEYTHLRVTNLSGDKSVANSFLWTLETAQQKDTLHFVEFDLETPGDIAFQSQGLVSNEPYIINGFTQAGSEIPGPNEIGYLGPTRGTLPIRFVDGTGNETGIKFAVGTDRSILMGIGLQGFTAYGVELNSTNLGIYGCEIGINADGEADGSAQAGIRIRSGAAVIGGWEHWQRNVVSGNGQTGDPENTNIFIEFGENNRIQGNIIGPSADGMESLGTPDKTNYGIRVETGYNLIGGSLINTKNTISDNNYGIYANLTGDYLKIIGNSIGAAWDKYTALGNDSSGIYLMGSDNAIIGGYSTKEGNTIANNGSGISLKYNVTPAIDNLIIGNSIHNNLGQGIDLGADNLVIPNDGLSNTSENNLGIDFPELISALNCDLTETVITYQLSVPTGINYRVEFFSNTSPDPTNGEGETFLGAETVTVTSNPQTFEYHYGSLLEHGESITATVSSLANFCTSEFGINQLVLGGYQGDITYSPICYGETAIPTIAGDLGGLFWFDGADPGDGAILNSTTGALSDGTEGASYSIVYGFMEGCNTEDTAIFTITNVDETFVMDDFCPETDGIAVPTVSGGTFAFEPMPGDGATLTWDTGILSGGVEGTIYTVQYINEVGTCADTGYVEVQVIPTNASFTLADFCPLVTSASAVPVEADGEFFFYPIPADGATINASTGAITGGVEGASYTVIYEVGVCSKQFPLVVNVIETDESFHFLSFCPESVGIPTDVAEPAGTFYLEFDLDDAEIDPTTGYLTSAVEGSSYNVIYEVGVCNDRDTVTTTVITVNEGFSFDDFCWELGSLGGDPIEPAGSWSFGVPYPMDGATITEDLGAISGASEGAEYTIVHTLSSGGCTQSDSLIVTAIGVDESFTFADFCPDEPSSPPMPMTLGGSFNFSVVPDDGATIESSTGIIHDGVEGATYEVQYIVFDETGVCSEESVESVSVITINEAFSVTDFCAEFSSDAAVPAVPGGTFDFAPNLGDGSSINMSTGSISSAVAGTIYAIEYTLNIGACAQSDTNYVYAKGAEDASFTLDDHCSNLALEAVITGTTGGTFDFFPIPDDGALINSTTAVITNSEGATYSVRYITEETPTTCRDTLVQSIELFTTPVINSLSSDMTTYCPGADLKPIEVTDEIGAFKIYWYNAATGGTALDSTFSFTPDPLNVGSNTFYAQAKSAHGCLSERVPYTLNLSDTSGMRAGDDLMICLGTSAQLEAYGGNTYLWTTDIPMADKTISNPIVFSLNEEKYIVQITNADHCKIVDTLAVTFSPQNDCEIELYNAFSPNEDGTNDFWYIENLINYLPNTVYIYNRWGDELRRIENYDNINAYWDGRDRSGNLLMPGTYFYVVITENQTNNQAGWVQLVR